MSNNPLIIPKDSILPSLIEISSAMEQQPENVSSVLELILETARNLSDSDEAAISQWDPLSAKFAVQSTTFGPPHWNNHFKLGKGHLSKLVMHSRSPIHIPDTQEDERINPLVLDCGIRSILAAPIGNQGVLCTYSYHPCHYHEQRIAILTLLGSQANVAINNSYLLTVEQTIQRAGQQLNSSSSQKDILSQILALIKGIIPYDTASVQILEPTNTLRVIELKGFPPERVEEVKRRRFQMDNPDEPNGQVIRGRKPLILQNASKQYRSFAEEPHNRIKAWIGVPMMVAEEVIGLITLDKQTTGYYTPKHGEIAWAFASHAANAIQNARLLEQKQEHVDMLEQLRQTSKQVAGEIQLPNVLKRISDGVQVLLQADSCAIWPYNPIRKRYDPENMVMSGIPDDIVGRERLKKQPYGIELPTQEDILFIRDVGTHDGFSDDEKRFFVDINAVSCYRVLLRADDENVGLLYVNYQTSPSEIQTKDLMLEAFAAEAALAIKKAQLYNQTRRGLEQLTVTSKAIRITERNDSTAEILQQVINGIQDALECDSVIFYPYNYTHNVFTDQVITAGLRGPLGSFDSREVDPNSLPKKIMEMGEHYAEDVTTDAVMAGLAIVPEGSRSSGGIALRVGQKDNEHVTGVLILNYSEFHRFSAADKNIFHAFADYLAAAMNNIELYGDLNKLAKHLRTMFDISKQVAHSNSEEGALNILLEAALGIANNMGSGALFANIQLFDPEQNALIFTNAWPLGILTELERKIGDRIPLQGGINGRIGITGCAFKGNETLLVHNARGHTHYIDFHPDTQCEIAVPMRMGDEIIGVLNVEHENSYGMDEQDKIALEMLTSLAVIAIEKANSRDTLQSMNKLVWLNIAHSLLMHEVSDEASGINWEVEEVLKNSNLSRQERDRLSKVKTWAKTLSDKTANTLRLDQALKASLNLNQLIRDRTDQLWAQEPYASTKCVLDLQLEETVLTQGNEEFLKKVLDILIDNAVEATEDRPSRVIKFRTIRRDWGTNSTAILTVTDTGKGIPKEQQSQIGRQIIDSSSGNGIGLFLAYAIAKAFGGKIRIRETSEGGTTMVVYLPIIGSSQLAS